MQIDDTLIAHLEELSRLQLTAEEREQIKDQLGQVVAHMDRLGQLPIDKEQQLLDLTKDGHVLRKDKMAVWAACEQILENAPQRKEGYFRVPKTME